MGRVENPTVFIVDDEPETRDSFAALISSMDLAAKTFASGEEFLQGINPGRPGCAVVDFRLAGMDGIELHRRLVAAGCKLPVILISGYLTVRATAGAMVQGVFRVLRNPIAMTNWPVPSGMRSNTITHCGTRSCIGWILSTGSNHWMGGNARRWT